MIEKTTKSGFPVGIALVGAFATTAGIGEITLKRTGKYFDRLLILRRRFGTIKQTQVKRRFVSKNLDYRQGTPPHIRREQYMNVR
jgi:hypothetical protein